MIKSVIIVYCFSLLHISVGNLMNLMIGDICELGSNEFGICKPIQDCPSALSHLTNKKRPKTCGFDGFTPIVCCSRNDTTTPSKKPEDEAELLGYGKVSSEKCKNYAGLVFQNLSSPLLLPDDDSFYIEDTCAIKKENYKEGFTLAREFPHLASIGYGSTERVWKCTGALISEKFVVTAATCNNLKKLGTAKSVRLGSTSVRENFYHETPLQYVNIKQFIKHPKFEEATLNNNLALIELEENAIFTSIVRPACLGVNVNLSTEALNVGWGTLNDDDYLNNEPLKNRMKIVEPRKCIGLQTNQLCVEQIPGIFWQNCLVDQGGPLQVYNDDNYCTYDIIGIIFDWRDCSRGKPAIYTNLSTYIPWIEKIVWG